MKRLRSLLGLAAGAGLALVTTSANADGPSVTYVDSCCFQWSGFYIGVHAGSASALVDWNNVSLTGERVNDNSTGLMGGAQIGYNWQFHQIVVGVESTLSATDLGNGYTSVLNPALTFHTDMPVIVTGTGRLGYAHGQLLLYGKGGWAAAREDVSGHSPANVAAFSFGNTRNGLTVGAGFEYMFSNGMSLGVDYSYVDFGSESVSGTTASGLPVAIRDVDTHIHLVTARVNFY
jgi:outer membrane immunogenic protein